jgi:hypothetical protein
LTEFLDFNWPLFFLLEGEFPALGTIFKHIFDEHPDTNGYWGHAGAGGKFVKSGKGLLDIVLEASVGLFGHFKSLNLYTSLFTSLK